MEFSKGFFSGLAAFLCLGYFLIKSDEQTCTKKFNVYACEKHVEWRPIQTQK